MPATTGIISNEALVRGWYSLALQSWRAPRIRQAAKTLGLSREAYCHKYVQACGWPIRETTNGTTDGTTLDGALLYRQALAGMIE